MFRIGKRYTFEAAHHLPEHEGKCRRVHGHSYKVDVVLEDDDLQPDGPELGMIIDFDRLDTFMRPLIEKLDHQDLNTIFDNPEQPPTAERLAVYFGHLLEEEFVARFARVRVWETEKSWAEWENE